MSMRRWLKLHGREISSKAAADEVLDAIAGHFTDVLLTTDNDGYDGYALHRSNLFQRRAEIIEGWAPWDYFLINAHRRGLRVHVWLIAGLWQHYEGLVTPLSADWNTASLPGCDQDWLNFSIAGARELVASCAEELVRLHPGLDGVYLDYVRYRSGMYGLPGLSSDDITQTVALCWEATWGYELNAGVYMLTGQAAHAAQQDWTLWLDQDLIDHALPMHYAYLTATAHTPAFAEALADYGGLDLDRVHPCVSVVPRSDLGALTLADLQQEFILIDQGGFGGSGIWCYTALQDHPELWAGVPWPEEPEEPAIRRVVPGQGGVGLRIEHTQRTVHVRPDFDLSGDAPSLAEMIEVPGVAVFVHTNRDGSLAVATGAGPEIWPEDKSEID